MEQLIRLAVDAMVDYFLVGGSPGDLQLPDDCKIYQTELFHSCYPFFPKSGTRK